jgi:hypothetical protein
LERDTQISRLEGGASWFNNKDVLVELSRENDAAN